MNANRQTGEVSMVIQGRTYRLHLDTNGMVKLEALFSTKEREMTFFDILERVNKNSVTHMRGLIWASLQKHQPDVTVEQTGALIEVAGGILKFGEQLQALMQSATPDQEDVTELGVPTNGNPPEAQDVGKRRGTGGRSTSTHAASA